MVVIRRLLYLLLLLPLWLSAQTQSKSVAPLFWQLEYQEKVSYAFGSIHLAEKDSYPLPEQVMKGFAATDALVVEVDLGKVSPEQISALTAKYGIDAKRPLKRYLGKQAMMKYNRYCKKKGLPCERFSNFKPWLASLTLMSLNFMAFGYSGEMGIDKYFIGQAGKDKPIIELESVDQQLQLFSGLSDKMQIELLMQSMEVDKGDMEALIGSWYRGDEKRMIELFNQTTNEEMEKVFREKMLFKRNHQMAAKLTELLKDKQRLFIVVGTAHLIGEQNILQLLQAQGVKVTKRAYMAVR